MEFKGTKGIWYVLEYGGFMTIQTGGVYGDSDILNAEDVGINEARANALLMSKSRELLEVMQEFVDRVDKGEVRSTKTYNKFKELIKEATEL